MRLARCDRPRQRGAVLVVSMVILVIVALLALSSLRGSATNLQVAANVQSRQEGVDAAQIAIERVISTREFFENPAAITGAPYSPLPIDFNRDGAADVQVVMQRPACLRARPVPSSELDPAVAQDRACMSSSTMSESGMVGNPALSGSICSDTEWQLAADAADGATGTRVAVRQGVAVRIRTTDADSACL